ncbi:MAG: hypothetical protein RR626_09415 [Anaerovoracaceae bacterium]
MFDFLEDVIEFEILGGFEEEKEQPREEAAGQMEEEQELNYEDYETWEELEKAILERK